MSLFTPHQEIIQTADHSSSSDSHSHRRGWKEAQLQILWIRDDWSRQGCASSRRQGCSVSVFSPIPKFTVNHSQKGKAGADRILQGCDNQSTIPAQPLHPSTALCEMTTSPLIKVEKYFFKIKNPVPQLYSTWPVQPDCPFFQEAQVTKAILSILSHNSPGPNSLGKECEREGKGEVQREVLRQSLEWPKALCLILPALRKEKCVASPSSSE